jgi:hypothetical protein
MKAVLIAVVAFFTSQLFGSESLEFVGYMTSADRSLFVLYDAEAKQSSLWIALGQDWHGYALKSFEPKTERLTVSKGMKDHVLDLRVSKVGRAASVLTLTKGAYKLMDGAVVYSPDARIKMGGNLIYSPTGVLVSDASQTIFSGDFTIETANGITQCNDAVLTVNDTGTKVSAKSVHIIAKPGGSNPLPSLPSKAATLP